MVTDWHQILYCVSVSNIPCRAAVFKSQFNSCHEAIWSSLMCGSAEPQMNAAAAGGILTGGLRVAMRTAGVYMPIDAKKNSFRVSGCLSEQAGVFFFFHFPCLETGVRAKHTRVWVPSLWWSCRYLKQRVCIGTLFASLVEKVTWGFNQIQNAADDTKTSQYR